MLQLHKNNVIVNNEFTYPEFMKRIYPDDMQLDQFLVLNETDYKVITEALEDMTCCIPKDGEYNRIKISQEEFDLCKAKILTRKNLQGGTN